MSAFIMLCLFANCKKAPDTPQSIDPFSIVVNSSTPMQIHGKYVFDLPCDTSHYMTVPVQVNQAGAWASQTDSLDGLKFSGSGVFSSTGRQIIKLYGSGSPASPERITFKLKVGSSEVSDTILPIESFLDIDLNGNPYLAIERPSDAGLLRSGPLYLRDGGVLVPSCEYFNATDPLGHFQLVIDYKGFPSYPGVEEAIQWEAYIPSKHPIADVGSPEQGFRFTLKYVAPSDLTTTQVVNDAAQFVQIISRGQNSTNILVQGQIKTFPVYRIKIKFSARLGDGFAPPFTISGEAIVSYWSMNAYM